MNTSTVRRPDYPYPFEANVRHAAWRWFAQERTVDDPGRKEQVERFPSFHPSNRGASVMKFQFGRDQWIVSARQAAPLLLAIGGGAVLAVDDILRRTLNLPPSGAPLEALQAWTYIAALAIGSCCGFVASKRTAGALAFAMALSFLFAGSAALLEFLLDSSQRVSACNAMLSFLLALVAMHVALIWLAPPGRHSALASDH
jgi:hypothetical protein